MRRAGTAAPAEPAAIETLTTADLADALRLSAAAQWNQNEADWRHLLTLGQGWAIRSVDAAGNRRIAASTVVVPYGGFAWISMVLVLPEFRRRGFATQLLRHALAHLAACGLSAVLDATPAGHAVYAKEGFADTWRFARYRRDARSAAVPAPAVPGAATRPIRAGDWPAIAALDAPAFGADRLPLLQRLASRLPGAAHVLEDAAAGRLRGFVVGRDGREAFQIGPLLADDSASAQALMGAALGAIDGPVFVDLLDRCAALLPWLAAKGFSVQRPFTRMVHGANAAPGDNSKIVLVAGPELG